MVTEIIIDLHHLDECRDINKELHRALRSYQRTLALGDSLVTELSFLVQQQDKTIKDYEKVTDLYENKVSVLEKKNRKTTIQRDILLALVVPLGMYTALTLLL